MPEERCPRKVLYENPGGVDKEVDPGKGGSMAWKSI
jgi:hypothetical protein